jgi:1-acyl-sn-glycerol-3-phosphate acyltransferase
VAFDSSRLPSFIDPELADKAIKAVCALRQYHRYHVEGMENIPSEGAALLVVSHSLATYDIAMLGYTICERTGRFARALADRLIFKIAPLAYITAGLGGVQGDPGAAARLLAEGEMVMVAPGGMREALRPRKQRYRISWEGRQGFAKLAIAAQVPVVCAACPAADDLYTLYPSKLTNFFLERFHFPVPVLRGLGPTLLPRPVALTHYIGAPMYPPKVDVDDIFAVKRFSREVGDAMNMLLQERPVSS